MEQSLLDQPIDQTKVSSFLSKELEYANVKFHPALVLPFAHTFSDMKRILSLEMGSPETNTQLDKQSMCFRYRDMVDFNNPNHLDKRSIHGDLGHVTFALTM